MTDTNELDYWMDGAPILDSGGSNDFDVWINGSPMLETDVTSDVVVTRRRVMTSFID